MMLIREAKIADLEGIRTLYAQLNPDDPEVTDGRDQRTLEAIIGTTGLFLFVGIVDGDIGSTCYLNIIPNLSRNVSPYGIIENVVTERQLQKRGYGKLMLRHALKHAWTLGCYKVMLQTGSKRESTHNFYKSCGFSAEEKHAFVARYPCS